MILNVQESVLHVQILTEVMVLQIIIIIIISSLF